jgi:hypothetical protein
MTVVMTKDGRVRPLQPSDLKEVAERDRWLRRHGCLVDQFGGTSLKVGQAPKKYWSEQ